MSRRRRRLDARDPLAGIPRALPHAAAWRRRGVYLCGNSLGLQPKSAARFLEEELEAWRRFGVEGHFRGKRPWKDYHEQFAAPLAALAGAREPTRSCA
jgi:kynureninase